MNEARPTISAIVISYNGMKFLPDCLATLKADLSDISHELIIVDNGSRDGSPEFIRKNYGEAVLIQNEQNRGFAPAVNAGLKCARGEYLYILNQDLRFPPGASGASGATSLLLERIRQDESIGFIGPKFVNFDGPTQKHSRSFPRYRHVFYRLFLFDRLFPHSREFASWRMGWFDHESELFMDQPMGAVMLIPRRVVEKIGLMDERFPLLFNDVDYCRRITEAGFKILYYPGAVVEHYVGASTGSRPYAIIVTSHTAMFRYFRKYARTQFNPVLWLCGLILYVSIPVLIAARFLRRSISLQVR